MESQTVLKTISSAERQNSGNSNPLVMKRVVVTRIPTKEGDCNVYLYHSSRHPEKEHMAFVYGDINTMQQDVLIRVHSECFTGEVIGSLRCDCLEQLRRAQEIVAEAGRGIVVYLRQEGRGIGLTEKLRAYNLQDKGLDTVDANLELGHGADERTYDEAALILKDLGVHSVRVLTNNVEKVRELSRYGINVTKRVPIVPKILTKENLAYLHTKVDRMNHVLDMNELDKKHSLRNLNYGGSHAHGEIEMDHPHDDTCDHESGARDDIRVTTGTSFPLQKKQKLEPGVTVGHTVPHSYLY